MSRSIKKYGWKKDLPNGNRDPKHIWTVEHQVDMPTKKDMRNDYMPPVYDQGQLGSCTANGICAVFDYKYNWNNIKGKFNGDSAPDSAPLFTPSRLFVYYNERVMEGDVGSDNGAQIRDGITSISTTGICQESECPYVISSFAHRPTHLAYKDAKNFTATGKSVEVSSISFKTALHNGYPVVFGFSVPSSFEGQDIATNGFLTYDPSDSIVGGHCVVACGYDDNLVNPNVPNDTPGYILVRNSWGAGWGLQGYFWMPYSFVDNANMCSDSWIILCATD
jgi:C1A family cysteine protease